MKQKFLTTLLLMAVWGLLFPSVSTAQQRRIIKGVVSDELMEPLAGASVVIKGSTRGVSTDVDGTYSIEASSDDALEYSYIGYEPITVKVGSQTSINVRLEPKKNELEEVTVVAFAKQKKESVVASIATVNPSELRVPSSNLTTAFAGRIAGMISYQRTGEPGRDQDNAQFFIRGVTTFGTGIANPLILIDNVEMTSSDLARLTTDDIASFSIMKDANATALYGARGANGVILVTTKEGREGKAKISFRAEGSYSSPTSTVDYADPVTYMKLHNEAVRTRDAMAALPYSKEKILYTEAGMYPTRYPAVDWQDMLFTDHTINHRYNLNVSGGGNVARYYVAASYSRDNGIIVMDKRNNFNSNIRNDRYVLRSNININLSKTTEAIVRLHGAFDSYQGPLDGGTELYTKARKANPVYFLPYYEPDAANETTPWILFGNYDTGNYLNPYAEMVRGYRTSDRSDIMGQFELKQKLDFILEGLSLRGLFNVNRYSLLEARYSYLPFYYQLVPSDDPTDYKLMCLNENTGREYVDMDGTPSKDLTATTYFEAALAYAATFNEQHDVSAMLIYTLRDKKEGGATTLQTALPYRNISLAGRATYGYDSRYFIELNFGYNGSERFARNERFGFFPSIGVGYLVSNESFMQQFKDVISKLKLKGTYGLVGNDAIGGDRFFYLGEVNPNNSSYGYTFGTPTGRTVNGISIARYADPLITWEISRKTNLGLEVNLFSSLEYQIDFFREDRSKIMQQRSYIPTTMGLSSSALSSLSANIGEAVGQGVDMSIDLNKSINKDLWFMVRGNFTYATSEYKIYEEPDYEMAGAPWRSHYKQKISQTWGYVAERLFIDEEEVKSAPTQFGTPNVNYLAGDIKYKDINGDMVINDNDKVPIGYPTTPEINYGFGVSAGYKGFDVSCFFQGSARSSFWFDVNAMAPFGDGSVSGKTTHRALLQYWADSYWSESNRDIHALWPRLSVGATSNNSQTSTWWMRDGSFLRLKTAELGYTLPTKYTAALHAASARFYLSGSNLAVWSVFKMWDPEMAGNGTAYPLQRVINFGMNVEF